MAMRAVLLNAVWVIVCWYTENWRKVWSLRCHWYFVFCLFIYNISEAVCYSTIMFFYLMKNRECFITLHFSKPSWWCLHFAAMITSFHGYHVTPRVPQLPVALVTGLWRQTVVVIATGCWRHIPLGTFDCVHDTDNYIFYHVVVFKSVLGWYLIGLLLVHVCKSYKVVKTFHIS